MKMPNLRDFINSKMRNAWVVDLGFEIYVRRSDRCFGADRIMLPAFDLATIQQLNGGRSGRFRELTEYMEELARQDNRKVLFVENVGPAFLVDALKRYGYTVYSTNFGSTCLYKYVDQNA